MEFHCESGLELLSRFSEKPSSINLDQILFPNGISNDSVVEIIGAPSTGKTLLLCQFLAKCILPAQHKEIQIDGCNACAILIDTLGHIQISKLAQLMSVTIHNAYRDAGVQPPVGTVDFIVNKSLENLTVINCCNNDQFLLTLHTLEDELFSNDRIVLLVIDNILAYYWQERKEKGILSMDSYVKNLVRVIQTKTSQFRTATVYTRWNGSSSKNEAHARRSNVSEGININYRLQLCNNNQACEFICHVDSTKDMKQVGYTICDSGIKWIL